MYQAPQSDNWKASRKFGRGHLTWNLKLGTRNFTRLCLFTFALIMMLLFKTKQFVPIR